MILKTSPLLRAFGHLTERARIVGPHGRYVVRRFSALILVRPQLSIAAVVLLPGMDGSGLLFADFAVALAPEIATIVVSYPTDAAIGYAELEAIAREQLPVNGPYFLLGESFSGPIAVSIAASSPEGLCGLILSCSFVRNPRPFLGWLRPVVPFMPTRFPGALSSWLLLGRFSSQPLRSALGKALSLLSPRALCARVAAVIGVDVTAELARICVPVLYLRATEDRVIPPSATAVVLRSLPAVAVVDLDGPHFLLQTAPVASARRVKEFVHHVVVGA